MKKYLTIHGHFYQPPRENPWTETIECQPSAAPDHDWNERITRECYFPNAHARILDASRRIVEIVNNYKLINFNFGPTLLSWLEEHAPVTYAKILEADRASVAHFGGHGSAIAQCYNHIIMPLAAERDQLTQIRWGIADFRHRFKREPESIWLPETAINQKTLDLLTTFPSLKYLILSPHQAQRFRPLTSETAEWNGVEHGEIDTRRPYRCFARDARGNKCRDRFLDIFFYHGDLARGISFEHLLRNASQMSARIDSAFGNELKTALVSIATDGETYGHHDRFGELGLAYLLNVEAEARDIEPINYSAFLAGNPPEFEVELKPGPNGEGTAWSCAHGVGRWYRNCGCSTGGEEGWQQEWRTPLRSALDNLRDRLNTITEEQGHGLFTDVWRARDAYIDVILDRRPATIEAFFAEHAARELSRAEQTTALKLMEIQRQAQLMYTSCGWFFTELSGLETVQILKYAARAIELAEDLTTDELETTFVADLRKARSNIKDYQNGEWIYNNFVLKSRFTLEDIIGHYAVKVLMRRGARKGTQQRLFAYDLHVLEEDHFTAGNITIDLGVVKAVSRLTLQEEEVCYVLLNRSMGEKLRCFIRKNNGDWTYADARDALQAGINAGVDSLFTEVKRIWKTEAYDLNTLLIDQRQEIVDVLISEQKKNLLPDYFKIYEKNQKLLRTIAKLQVDAPEELAQPTRIALKYKILAAIHAAAAQESNAEYEKAVELVRLAQKLGITIDLTEVASELEKLLQDILFRLKKKFEPEVCTQLLELNSVQRRMQLEMNSALLQDTLYEILKTRIVPAIEKINRGGPDVQALYKAVNQVLQVAYHFNFNIKIYKDRLKPFEGEFSRDPEYWP